MSRIFLIAALLTAIAQGQPTTTAAQAATTQPPSGREVIKKMYDRYAGHWYRTFTFDQTTQQYRDDTLSKTQTWYEFMRFPDRFRIDFGDADSGNATFYRGDSCYWFKNFTRTLITINNNEGLIFLLGGMYFYPMDRVYSMLDTLQFDLSMCKQDRWQGQPVFVIGRDGANQLWIDSEQLYVVRIFKVHGQSTLDARFDGYQRFDGGWSPTKCSFFLDGKLVQLETYHHCKADVPLGESLFDPARLVRSH